MTGANSNTNSNSSNRKTRTEILQLTGLSPSRLKAILEDLSISSDKTVFEADEVRQIMSLVAAENATAQNDNDEDGGSTQTQRIETQDLEEVLRYLDALQKQQSQVFFAYGVQMYLRQYLSFLLRGYVAASSVASSLGLLSGLSSEHSSEHCPRIFPETSNDIRLLTQSNLGRTLESVLRRCKLGFTFPCPPGGYLKDSQVERGELAEVGAGESPSKAQEIIE